jgi:hypothetical protein
MSDYNTYRAFAVWPRGQMDGGADLVYAWSKKQARETAENDGMFCRGIPAAELACNRLQAADYFRPWKPALMVAHVCKDLKIRRISGLSEELPSRISF